MAVAVDGRSAVRRLAVEAPEWLPAVRAAVELAQEASGGDFAGSWILRKLQSERAPRTWYPNFRRLVTFGILVKAGGSRGGQRAYYRMPDIAGVRRGLEDLDRLSRTHGVHAPLSFTGIGRSGRPDLSASADDILRSDFPNR